MVVFGSETWYRRRHLCNCAENILDYLHAFHFGANVQWRESRDALNDRSHFVRD
jgi:hypothetical protein